MQRHWIFRLIRSCLATASFQHNWSSSQVQTTGSGTALVTGTRLRGNFCAPWRGISLRERIDTGNSSGAAELRGLYESSGSVGAKGAKAYMWASRRIVEMIPRRCAVSR